MGESSASTRRRLEIVARLFRTAREGQGIPIRKIAKEAGVSSVVVSNIERGIPGYTIASIEAVVEALLRLSPPVALDRVLAKIDVDPVRGEEPREAAGTIETPGPVVRETGPRGEPVFRREILGEWVTPRRCIQPCKLDPTLHAPTCRFCGQPMGGEAKGELRHGSGKIKL